MIPRVFHRIWLGSIPMPDAMARWGETWQALHPDWDSILWTTKELAGVAPEVASLACNLSQLADLYRYHILREMGGVYVDTDYECRRNIEPRLAGLDFAAVRKTDCGDVVFNGFIASVPAHPVLCGAVKLAHERLHLHGHEGRRWAMLGPSCLSAAVAPALGDPRVGILSVEEFLPYWASDMVDRKPLSAENFPNAYAVHHWSSQWWLPSSVPFRSHRARRLGVRP